MIEASDARMIDGLSLQNWLQYEVEKRLPNAKAQIIPRSWEAKGESRFFCEIDIDDGITLDQLIQRTVADHNRGNYMHFYADDVVYAAYKEGLLVDRHYYLYYRW